jgi:hypothetical protein
MIPHVGQSVGGPYTIPVLISRGMVGYRPTTTIIKLRRFTRPHKSNIQSVHNQMLIQGSTTNGPRSTQAGATTLEPRISTSLSPTFPSDDTPLFPSCPAWSQIKTSFYSLSSFNHFNSIRGKKGSYMRVKPTTRLLPLGTTKQSTTNGIIIYKSDTTRIIRKRKAF